MATLGLKGIWGLEQLDKTGIATWKLGLISMGVAGVVGYILMKLCIGMEPNPVFGPIPPQTVTALSFGLAFLMVGLAIFAMALARAIEIDLKELTLFDNVIDASIEKLRPKRAFRMTCIVLGLLYGYLLLPTFTFHGPRLNLTFVEAFIASTGGGPQLIYGFILMPFLGLILGLSWAIVISQIISLIHAARHIKIDFLQLKDYAAIANPGVRLFLFFIPLLSVFPLMGLYAPVLYLVLTRCGVVWLDSSKPSNSTIKSPSFGRG